MLEITVTEGVMAGSVIALYGGMFGFMLHDRISNKATIETTAYFLEDIARGVRRINDPTYPGIFSFQVDGLDEDEEPDNSEALLCRIGNEFFLTPDRDILKQAVKEIASEADEEARFQSIDYSKIAQMFHESGIPTQSDL